MPDLRRARALLESSIHSRIFPGASVEVGTATGPLWQAAVGTLTYEGVPEGGNGSPVPVAADTIYDLASLTKVVATASVAMRGVEQGGIGLDDPVANHVPGWSAADRRDVTIRDLLSHCSGLPAHRPFYREHTGEDAFVRAICAEPLEYAPGSRAVYSDLGFILLAHILGRGRALADPFATFWSAVAAGEELQFLPPALWRARTAPTEFDPSRGRLLVGEVHDENCWALGGVAGHAGLFGTASAVGTFARHVLQVFEGRVGSFGRATLDTFAARRTDVPGSSRGLGWDTMLPTSSCGTRMSARAIGHTGFTGTSLWIDPERGYYYVLLTNRVYPSRDAVPAGTVTRVRAAFHDAANEDLDEAR
jgi:CubicO group peptidase (beta-lactamase class C family)